MLLKYVFRAIVLAVFLAFGGQISWAQTETPKVELGINLTTMRLSELKDTDVGFGGRATFNLNSHVAVEGELNFFPRDLDNHRGNRLQGLFGVKAGQRWEKLGLFAKARPGFMRFGESSQPVFCAAILPQPLTCLLARGKTEFALDLGGVAEFYPSKRTVVRFDLGDTLIRYRGPFGRPGGGTANNLTSHNLQFNVGFGFRF